MTDAARKPSARTRAPPSRFTLENTIFNLFARFDWEMGERHDAMLRYSFASADDEPDPNRPPR